MRFFKTLAITISFLLQLGLAALAQGLPPTPPVKIAVNPVTNKVYLVNETADSVTAFNAATGTSTTIPVGARPLFIAVNPVTNRIFVNNSNAATLSVIDGATDTVIGTHPIGAVGPITINPTTNVVYIVRLTGPGTDEVTYFNANGNDWYTIATNSFQPNAMAVNPTTNKIYVAHYATGDVRVISGTYDANDFHPATVSIGVWSKPFAIAANPVTNKIYVTTEDSRGPIGVINGADNSVVFPAVTAGHALQPKALVVNPVSNKIYAAFANEVIVVNGSDNALTYIPITGAGSGAVALGVNYLTNRIFVASALGTLTIIDGDSDTVLGTESIPAGMTNVGVNQVTGTSYYYDTVLHTRGDPADEAPHAIPLTTNIAPFHANSTGPSGTFTFTAANAFSPTSLPVRAVYFQVDSKAGSWTRASGGGPLTGAFSGLAPGTHTVYAFALDGQDAPLHTGPQSIPLVGQMASYTFAVTASSKPNPTVSVSTSANPSPPGQLVTFTASVSGSAGTPTGAVSFFAGGTAIAGCSSVALTSGSASCSTSALAAGTHSISVQYPGDATYNAAVSSAFSQVISTSPGRVVNLSSRALVQTGNNVVIGGFIIGGGAPKTVVVRARGPSLTALGMPNALANPVLSLISGQTVIASNDDWGTAANASAVTASGFAPSDPRESAILMTLAPGAYTAIVAGSGGGTGVGLVEIFEVDHPEIPLINISTRANVLTGNDVLIGGFIIQGSARTVVVRARGPSMASQVPGTLANPLLQLFSGQTQIAFNDDWGSAENSAQISSSGFAPPDSRESAILITLQPGAYTAIVTGVGGTTGIGIVEVFSVP
jgi:hypothetical protein